MLAPEHFSYLSIKFSNYYLLTIMDRRDFLKSLAAAGAIVSVKSSGIDAVVKKAGATMVPAHEQSYYENVNIPNGKSSSKTTAEL